MIKESNVSTWILNKIIKLKEKIKATEKELDIIRELGRKYNKNRHIKKENED